MEGRREGLGGVLFKRFRQSFPKQNRARWVAEFAWRLQGGAYRVVLSIEFWRSVRGCEQIFPDIC